MYTLTPNFASTLHKPFCDCFECASPDAAIINNHAEDWLLKINDALGFGAKAGDWIELTKVVNIYDGKGSGKVIAPPVHLQIDHITPKFIYITGLVTKDGITNTYKGWYIYNDESTFIVIPKGIAKTIATVDKGVASIKDFGVNLFGDLWGKIKWLLIAIVVILVIVLVIKLT